MFRTARRLDGALKGRAVTWCDLRWPSLATVDLRDRTVLGTFPRGKHLLTRFDDGLTLHSHLRMDGSWRVVPAGRRPPGGHGIRAILGNPTSTAVGIHLGVLDLLRTEDEDQVVGHLGPDLLDPGWSDTMRAQAVANLAADPERPVADALLDQRNLAGCGTIFTAEPLFAAGIGPLRPTGRVDDLARLVDVARRQLRTGALSDMRPRVMVYKREGLPCRICGTTVTSTHVGAAPQSRRIYYCPACQT